MARVTIEDCLEKIDNRFKLVLLGSKRARKLAMGAEPFVKWENDKPTVVALREIAEGKITEESMKKPAARDFDESLEDLMAANASANEQSADGNTAED